VKAEAVRVLVVEDDNTLRRELSSTLAGRGYAVDTAADGRDGLFVAQEYPLDAAVIDLGLPGIDGVELIRRVRGAGRDYPILILTARDGWRSKVEGLEAGADDYLVKPFDIRELSARINAMVRRRRGHVAAEMLRVADLTLDTATLEVQRGGQKLNLTPTNLRMLTVLMRASPRIVNRRDLEQEVWGDDLPDSDTLRSHLYTLRKVIDKPFPKPLLHTVHGAGYRLADTDETAHDA